MEKERRKWRRKRRRVSEGGGNGLIILFLGSIYFNKDQMGKLMTHFPFEYSIFKLLQELTLEQPDHAASVPPLISFREPTITKNERKKEKCNLLVPYACIAASSSSSSGAVQATVGCIVVILLVLLQFSFLICFEQFLILDLSKTLKTWSWPLFLI